ncbi:enzyme activator [Coprinopsis cinerea okayama7|uniref:Enzyme activator n=1 Tax=Coprinopsis cinerea (strain Okayama-7 / 130 / ATCC MYA-4618 / FGSC 9003) TaxID=240176 RepID=A8NG86_COPC7|nr:enzyme activator [Coprinopsis cinerea okayama7\|eukprot:XP_001833507.1 enzyme activator [Coprinopsis cinerea okayama7\
MYNDQNYHTQHAQYYNNRDSDPTHDLSAGFSALSVSHHDPIARSHSAMSMHSAGSHGRHHPPQPRHAATLPYNNPGPSYDNAHYNGHYNDPYYAHQQWAPANHTPAATYDPLYAAASDILGMGPPPPPPPPPPHHLRQPGHHPPPAPYHHPPGQIYPDVPPGQQYSDTQSLKTSPSTVDSYTTSPSDYQDFELRGPVKKAVPVPSSQGGKAIDLNAPPYTKEYIDQYRQRIKADPDPEAHFLYAKYLIEAAKRFRTQAKDARAGKKYSEFLIGEALKVVRRLATQGDAYDEAQFFLANCYGTGALGLQVDHEKAYHLYLQAAKQNHAAAAYRVAVCNEIGAGTKREPPRAAAFYRKAASLGDTAAMYKLGMILLHGLLDEQKNPRDAVSWLKRAAEQADEENPHALHELALLYEQPNSNLVPHDPVHAKQLYTQAAQLGYTPAQFKLGQCYEYGSLSCPVDPRRSIAWYTKAAEKGDAEAELALSGWYLTGSEGVLKQSDSEAYLWARRAANKGLSKAEYAVGYYAEVGIGIKQDIEFAKRWYMRAAAQGNKRAMNRLTEMKRMGNKRPAMARPTRQQAKDECVII